MFLLTLHFQECADLTVDLETVLLPPSPAQTTWPRGWMTRCQPKEGKKHHRPVSRKGFTFVFICSPFRSYSEDILSHEVVSIFFTRVFVSQVDDMCWPRFNRLFGEGWIRLDLKLYTDSRRHQKFNLTSSSSLSNHFFISSVSIGGCFGHGNPFSGESGVSTYNSRCGSKLWVEAHSSMSSVSPELTRHTVVVISGYWPLEFER